MAAHIARQAMACDAANLRADHLDRAHERIGEHERRPDARRPGNRWLSVLQCIIKQVIQGFLGHDILRFHQN
jgi:hypothetical protein